MGTEPYNIPLLFDAFTVKLINMPYRLYFTFRIFYFVLSLNKY